MPKFREILRLRHTTDSTIREIAASCRVSKSTVSRVLFRARMAGIAWPFPDEFDEEALAAVLYPDPVQTEGRPLPDWEEIRTELGRKGVTLQLLWREYREAHPDGYGYARFCQLYGEWAKRRKVVMHLEHKGGEAMYVDFAGLTMLIANAATGEVTWAHIFVASMAASSFTFARAMPDESRFSYLMGQVYALEFFGGVPEAVIPDNPKTGVKHPSFYDPELNPAYQEFAAHYGVVVLPARPRKPRDKAGVESGVGAVERDVLAPLRKRTFFSVAELNEAMKPLVQALNDRPFQKREGSRRSVFEAVDRPALRPLPAHRYEYAEVKRAQVSMDDHIEVGGAFYSVPYPLAKKEVWVRATAHTVEISFKGRRVASHPRAVRRGQYQTDEGHMPSSHLRYRQAPSFIIGRAHDVGKETEALVRRVLEDRPHPEQGYRSCLGILKLGSRYGDDRLEAACRRARSVGGLSYRSVRSILEKGLDRLPLETPEPTAAGHHENVRGAGYFQKGGDLHAD